MTDLHALTTLLLNLPPSFNGYWLGHGLLLKELRRGGFPRLGDKDISRALKVVSRNGEVVRDTYRRKIYFAFNCPEGRPIFKNYKDQEIAVKRHDVSLPRIHTNYFLESGRSRGDGKLAGAMAGFELGSGFFSNSNIPETDAADLRAAVEMSL